MPAAEVIEPSAIAQRLATVGLTDFVSAVKCMWPDFRTMNIS